ncbi:vanadium-dependent haloperoxidase [Winogradskyella eckloniae]|uniref:vanadium-dependent haloperoxidase n=1 Tax=Winogradskyella eckloniae TaxID=1089306 RepID=UPI0015671FD2|nr:vanadium-dependent haloperoxidase [Winogradskyella eckloniae]NRD20105.1 vanadium-dependent haloperoxidase [Winogradskyella eckloniae]
MKTTNLKFILILCMIITVFQSCSTDEATENFDEDVSDDFSEIEVTNNTTSLIVGWNDLWVSLDQYTVNMRPNIVTRALAYIHLTAYETAVPYMDDYSSNTNRINNLNINNNFLEDNVDMNLALNTAYALAIDHFMHSLEGGQRQRITAFETLMENELTEGLTNVEIANSQRWGTHVAQRVIAYAESDRDAEEQIIDQTPSDYIAPEGLGLWEAAENEAAWFPYWREVRTFALSPQQSSSVNFNSVLQHSSNPSSNYYQQMNTVYVSTTNAAATNNEDLWIAEFWADDVEGLMISPPGRHISIANQLIEQYDLDFDQTLELLLRLGFALNDAAVSAWDDKYTYNIERPSHYIKEYIDEDFTTNLSRFISGSNPAFPSYPSGHATFAGVAAGVFIDFFGTDTISFTDRTYSDFGNTTFNGTARSFTSFSEMAYENAYSRVPLGVHIEQDAIEGLRLGYEISDAVNSINLRNRN